MNFNKEIYKYEMYFYDLFAFIFSKFFLFIPLKTNKTKNDKVSRKYILCQK